MNLNKRKTIEWRLRFFKNHFSSLKCFALEGDAKQFVIKEKKNSHSLVISAAENNSDDGLETKIADRLALQQMTVEEKSKFISKSLTCSSSFVNKLDF